MGKEQGCEYYDSIFGEDGLYTGHISKMPWIKIWRETNSQIIKSGVDHVIDLGCGPGHLSQVLSISGYKGTYDGYDFSESAIGSAEKQNTNDGFRFEVKNLKGCRVDLLPSPSQPIYVACEFLEHVEWDLELLRTIPSGSTIIGTVPNFDDMGHVRHFKNLPEVMIRYSQVLDITMAKMVGRKHFIFCGVRT